MSWYKNKHVWSAAAGAAAVVAGYVVAKAPCTRKLAVAVAAKGIELKDLGDAKLQEVKDEAEDLAEEARQKAKRDRAYAERKAAIEARVRAEVEAELAKDEQ